ncbi:MAG: hypothetical protein WCS37_02885 [Chloroflexota bacterium]|nr:hypothetical protein [Chloroflexota bacterium]
MVKVTFQEKTKKANRLQNWPGRLISPALAVLVFFGSLYFLTGTYFTKGISDGEVMAQTAIALAQQHTVQLPSNPGLPQIIPGKKGRYFSKYGIGQPLMTAGLYLSGQVFSRTAMPKADENIIGHFFIMLLPILATAFTAWLVYLWGQELYQSVRVGLGLALLFGLGTNAWPYTKVFFSEPLFTLCIFGAAFTLWKARRAASSGRYYLWVASAGFLLGYSFLTRISGVILLPSYLVYLFLDFRFWILDEIKAKIQKQAKAVKKYYPYTSSVKKLKSKFFFSGLALLLGMLPGLGLILLHNYVRFGNIFNNGYDEEFFTNPLWVGLSGLLLSPGKSLFLYSPVLLALPFAVVGFWRRARAEAILLSLVCGITLLYYSLWWAWEGGWCWGPRFLVPLLPFLILPLGHLLQKHWRWVIVLFGFLLPLAMVVQILGVALDFNTYLATLSNNADSYIWSIEASPLINHWMRLGEPSNNLIRSLTLEQVGFRPFVGHLVTWVGLILFVISGLLLCLSYLKATKPLNPKPLKK